MRVKNTSIFVTISALLVISLSFTGCTSQVQQQADKATELATQSAAQTPVSAAPTGTPVATQPRYGGNLLLMENADPPNLDIHQSITIYLLHPLMPVYNGIVQYDPLDPEKIIGDLAESWDISPDAKEYTFRFRKGVKWQDGKAFAAEDAKFNLERMLDPKTRSPRIEYLKPRNYKPGLGIYNNFRSQEVWLAP
ncbi:MAG: hypothetical protein HYX92_12930 [Chloroflexi bacterium]|nr:hypothetical protein [Chloroflexota bacterium]